MKGTNFLLTLIIQDRLDSNAANCKCYTILHHEMISLLMYKQIKNIFIDMFLNIPRKHLHLTLNITLSTLYDYVL